MKRKEIKFSYAAYAYEIPSYFFRFLRVDSPSAFNTLTCKSYSRAGLPSYRHASNQAYYLSIYWC